MTDPNRLEHIRRLVDGLSDARVLHVNSTATGGGVAEILRSLVPLCRNCGLETDWFVMDADEAFFEVTKALHNGLQGEAIPLTNEMATTYEEVTTRNAEQITDEYDAVVLHDPQPLGMLDDLADRFPRTTFLWRCHLDLSTPTTDYLEFIADRLEQVDHAIFSRASYANAFDVDVPAATVIHPSIDPLAEKNRPLPAAEKRTEHEWLEDRSLSFDAPILTQISRFDPWKGQPELIDAFRRIREQIPTAQLVLAGSTAADDPEGRKTYDRVLKAAANEPIRCLTDCSDRTVNALQRRSDIVCQPSIREGFGLVVSEALWKSTPVVGSNVGGIPLQILDGKTGYLVEPRDVEALALRAECLLEDDGHRTTLGRRGREHVREHFLLPRHLEDYLVLFDALIRSGR